MKKPYLANQLLKGLAQNLGFRIFIFDDPSTIGPEIKLKEKSKKAEIDAVLLFQNVICLVGINGGKGIRVERELKKFFEKLEKIEKVEDLELELQVLSKFGKDLKEQKAIAEESLGEVKEYIKTVASEYHLILKKVFFCPARRIEEETLVKMQEKEKTVIDRDIFDYFQEVVNRLNRRFLFNDFMHFLNIRKIDLTKKGASKLREPARSSPFSVNRLEVSKDKIIMYSSSVRVEDIVDNVTVLRIARKYDKKGFQRMIKATRLDKINDDYLSKNETFPNNVIIALSPELYKNEADFYKKSKSSLSFFDEYNSLFIIDGQHRFFSLVKGRKEDRPILVNLLFFFGQKEEQKYLSMYRMFYQINKKQERIDPNLSFILVAKIDPESEENFWYSVFRRLDKKGYFASRFSFKESTVRKRGEPRSIISVITYGGILRLNKTYKRKGIEVLGLETFYSKDREKNVDFAFNLMKNYFDIIEAVLHHQRVDKNFLTPREIGALFRLLKHFVIDDQGRLKDLGSVKNITKQKEYEKLIEYFEERLNCIPFKEAISLDYPASNWAAVEGYMLRKINLKKPNFGNKNLLSRKGLEVYEASG